MISAWRHPAPGARVASAVYTCPKVSECESSKPFRVPVGFYHSQCTELGAIIL
jgi:hypothetical protein